MTTMTEIEFLQAKTNAAADACDLIERAMGLRERSRERTQDGPHLRVIDLRIRDQEREAMEAFTRDAIRNLQEIMHAKLRSDDDDDDGGEEEEDEETVRTGNHRHRHRDSDSGPQ